MDDNPLEGAECCTLLERVPETSDPQEIDRCERDQPFSSIASRTPSWKPSATIMPKAAR